MAYNLHIYPSNFKNESRIEKLTKTLSTLNIFSNIEMIGRGEMKPSINTNGVSLHLLGGENNPCGILKKITGFINWYLCIAKHYWNTDISCVNAHSLSSLPICFLLSQRHKCTLIYDAHELETETNGLSGVRQKISKVVERWFIPKIDHTFVVSESIKQHYLNSYGAMQIDVVLNSPSPVVIDKHDIFRQTFNIKSHTKIFLYQGVISEGRGIELLLNTFSQSQNQKFAIVFMGYGQLVDKIKLASDQYDNIFYHDAVPPRTVLNYTSSADIGFSLIEDTCLSYRYCMPNKLFEYGMVGLPSIVSNLPEMKKYVEGYNAGFTLLENTQVALTDLLRSIDNSDLSVISKNAKEHALNNSWDVQAKTIKKTYASLFNN
ncbi:MAG: glycosyltransferase [Glaciecola sp.]